MEEVGKPSYRYNWSHRWTTLDEDAKQPENDLVATNFAFMLRQLPPDTTSSDTTSQVLIVLLHGVKECILMF